MVSKISIIIPTLNAASSIGDLIARLLEQTIHPEEIVIIDSSSTDNTVSIAASFPHVSTIVIPQEEFNHGKTRHKALMATRGEFVCFLTQDAMPIDNEYLQNLLAPFACPKVALCTGKQEPKEDAFRYVQLVQSFNYPDKSNIRELKDVDALGIKAFFASDVCSAYRKEAYLECGGFERVNTNEDMLMAAALLKNGWSIAYVSDARVSHSHNFSFRQQYERNRQIGYFLETHSDNLLNAKETAEGVSLVKTVVSQLVNECAPGELVRFGSDCLARILGNRSGRLRGRRARNTQVKRGYSKTGQ